MANGHFIDATDEAHGTAGAATTRDAGAPPQVAFWREALAGAPVALELPLDRARASADVDHAIDAVEFALARPLAKRVHAFARARGIEPRLLFLAAWAVLLSRLSNQDDLLVGSAVARGAGTRSAHPSPEHDATLPLRIDTGGDPSTDALLVRVRTTYAAAQANAGLPHALLVAAANAMREEADAPLFHTRLRLRDEDAAFPSTDPQVDLALELDVRKAGIEGRIVYPGALFDRDTVTRFADGWQRLLDGMIATPALAASRLAWMGEAERTQVLRTWNDTARPYPQDRGLHQLFEAAVAADPDAIAVIEDAETLTYGELDRRANRIAHRLLAAGVGPEHRVLLCVERGAWALAGLLGVLKAGGAYVPVDPNQPVERTRMVREDCAPVAILARARHAAIFAAEADASGDHATPIICLDREDWAQWPGHAPTHVASPSPRHLAYVIYTSGSTGRPKGVLLEHRSAVARIAQAVDAYALTPADRCLQFASLSFDASVMQIFSTLAAGATLVMRDETLWSPAEATRRIARHRVAVADLPPSYLPALLDPEAQAAMTTLRIVVVGGEATLTETLRDKPRGFALINEYGPTEATITATSHRLDAGAPCVATSRHLPIGKPVANTQVYVLDRHRQPVPVGVGGEICISGIGVARGYLHRPGLTADRFVEDPFAGDAGARMYRTGDLGRWRPDGTLEFLGRDDHQVKIRGFRIELGEIEAGLLAHGHVRDAVVLVREDAPGDRRLVAYYQSDAAVPADSLRQALAAHLPDYMVPSAYVHMATWPFTPNGKLDRRALPAPTADACVQRAYEPPQGERETAMAALWRELLRLDRVGRHDHFFELGGHSLIAITLIERLRQQGIVADIHALFAHPTLAGFANAASDDGDVPAPANAIPPGAERIVPDMLPLVALTQAQIDGIAARVQGGAANIQDIHPLSPMQEGMLFHSRLEDRDDIYLITDLLSLPDRDGIERFVAAFRQVVARHDALRTAFFWEGLDAPVQVVLREVAFEHEKPTFDPAAGSARAQLLAKFDPARHRFDLARAPLFRLCSTEEAETGRMLLAIASHHLLMDHATLDLMLEEVGSIQRGIALPAPVPFRDHVWRAMRRGDAQRHDAFFTAMLAGIDQPTAPFGHVEPIHDGRGFVECREALPPALSAAIRQQARAHGVGPAAILHLAWAMLLARATGMARVVFGTVLFGRMDAGSGADRAFGLFINTLPIRIDLDTDVAEAVRRTHATLGELLRHEHAPLAIAQRCSGVPASQPLFTSLFNYLYNADPARFPDGLVVEPIENGERTAYPLSISVADDGNGFGLIVQTLPAIGADRIAAFLRTGLTCLVDALEHRPRTPSRAIDPLPADESRRVLREWNATARPFPRDGTVHAVFEAQVARDPHAIALSGAGRTLSYDQLDRAANRIAHRLIAAGVAPDDRVAICMPRSVEMVIGFLAILKAGAGYVPIDPTYPPDRIAALLDDARPTALLATAATRDALPSLANAVATLDIDAALAPGRDDAPCRTGVDGHTLAYVIYTSGSTGTPKGVMVEHRNILRLAVNNTYAPVGAGDCLAHCSNPAFDASTWEIWAALLNGARVEVIAQEDVLEPAAFAQALVDGNVTALWMTVGLFNEYLDALAPTLGRLRHLLIGGDALDARKVAQLLHGPHRPQRLVNGYGPTETTTFALTHEIVDVAEGARSIPIGRPIANTQAYLLDADLRPVPVGVAGELYIGGDGVARGYLDRPELTAERFLDDPFAGEPGARMYRTGDLGRWRADGTVEFLGRNDHQVKIRGFRIELGEIESRLSALPGVREAVVLAREDVPGEKRLVAYVVGGDDTPEAATLRQSLSQALPEYMVPSAFVTLASLPLTPNGKVDRKALPAPQDTAYASRAYEAPEGSVEEAVASIWSSLLRVERVGRHDNFFDLGGHSLVAMRMVSRVRQALGIELPLRDVFEAATPARLAERIAAAGRAALPAIPQAARDGWLPLSPAQQRLWFLTRIDGASAAYHVGAVFRLHGPLDRDALRRALDGVVARHEILRTRCQPVDGQPMLDILPPAPAAWRFDDLRGDDADAVEHACVQARGAFLARPFDLQAECPLRAQLLQLRDDLHEWQLLMHHIASDGWSLGVMLDEIGRLYAIGTGHDGAPLPPLPLQYADYAQWQRQWLADDRLQRQIAYWQRTLRDAPVLLELPSDRPRPSRQSFAGRLHRLRLEAGLATRLKALGRRHDATLYMTLLAAWAAILGRLSGQDDVVVGSPVAGRDRAEIEPLIGFFVNTLALRIDVDGALTVAQLLRQTRQRVLEAQANQELPFDQVVEAVKPPRSTAHAPIFQTLFAWQHQDMGRLALAGIETAPVDADAESTEFDLTLDLREEDGGIVGELHYATDLFDAGTIARHVGHWQRLLQAMVEDDACRIDALPILDDAERHQLLHAWNATTRVYPPEARLDRAFARQAAQTPAATALLCGDAHMTYAALDARADALAHALRSAGAAPGHRVAICAERTIATIAAILAVLKTGAAYVPLDPAYPPDRLAYQLDDAQVSLLVADATGRSALADALAGLSALPVFALEQAWTGSPAPSAADAACAIVDADTRASDPAYMIYTSGSTGLPKGTVVGHASATGMARGHCDLMRITPDSRVLQFASLAFDVCVAEVFSALLSGAALVLPAPGRSLYGDGLIPHLRAFGVTHALMPPALLSALPLEEMPASLQTVVLGGEVPDAALIDRLLAGRRVINAYGPTEATVCATMHEWTSGAQARVIGRPMPNVRVYILDTQRQPVPAGVAGELYIGGDGVALGYWNRPELTSERFLDDPFAGEPGARMYRTGDLGRWRADGTVEFLGRNDHQVKIRGFRIELGEIEARLSALPGVREAVVLAREDVPGEKRLVAYVVGGDDTPEAAPLRQSLSQALPEYMVPSAFVTLASLPLTPNGKVDRKALPAPQDTAYASRAYEAPEGPVEEAVASIWSSLLRVERVGRHDNFFDLGGHSLVAVTLVERMRKQGLDADVRALFMARDLREFAREVRTEARRTQVPPNGIPAHAERIEPAMLPLVALTQAQIDTVVARIDGGAANVQDLYPLSPMQEGMLFQRLLTERGDPYHATANLSFPDRAALEAFVATLQQVIDRHDVLRTAFVWEGLDQPLQVVQRSATFPNEILPASDDAGDVRARLAARLAPADFRMDLTRAPLLCGCSQYDPATDRWRMCIAFHHLLMDHTSLEVVMEEASLIGQGRAAELLRPAPYRNYIWQVRHGVDPAAQKAFFTRMLGSVEQPTTPFGLATMVEDVVAFDECARPLPQALSARWRQCARELGVGTAAIAHLAWALVLARATGTESVVFGTVLFGRMDGGEDADRALGLFINSLPIRIDLETRSVIDAIRQAQQALADLLPHEHASLAAAQRCSGVPASSPLFTSLINYRYSTHPVEGAAPTLIDDVESGDRTNYPLAVAVDDFGDAFEIAVQTLSSVGAARVCDYLQAALAGLIDAMAADPAMPVSAIDVMPADEFARIVHGWNETARPFPLDRCAHELLANRVAERPEAVAVVHVDQRITYRELDARANRLAHHLRERGIGPGALVAVALERGLDMVATLLAVMKAGAAYVPMATDTPADRMAFMLSDAKPALLLAHRSAQWPETVDVPVCILETVHDTLTRYPDDAPSRAGLDASDPAYVIYTSGTTGLPKGVVATHRNLVNFCCWCADMIAPGDAMTQFAPYTFDASAGEIFSCLLAGGELHILDDATIQDPKQMERYLVEQRIRFAAFPPSYLQHMDPSLVSDKFQLLTAGSAPTPELVKHWAERGHYLNGYGPTETTILSTITRLSADEDVISIGRPIANTSVYLLDALRRPVPVGASGEIWIGGEGVTAGYLNRPELTRERFLPDPFHPGAGASARMYATGDVGRWLPDGNIEFLGRNDFQVKIRGFRIELGEIESRLCLFDGIREAVVLAREDARGEKQLVAYYLADHGHDAAEMRRHLAQTLPEYMIPAAFVQLERWPLTVNGKIDRKALPAPADTAYARRDYAPPEGEAEAALAAIWSELLGVDRVGRHDHFFELGGHSLLAVQLVSRARRALGVELPLRALFEAPVLCDLAARAIAADAAALTPIAVVPRDGPLPLSLAQQRLWFLTRIEGASAAYHMGGAVRLRGRLDLGALSRALQRIVDRHEALRTRFTSVAGEPVQDILPRMAFAPEHHDLRAEDGREALARALGADAFARPFDLGTGPLLRVVHARMGDEDHLLYLVMHHIVGDGWSIGVLLRELNVLYRADVEGAPDPLPPLAIQYADYAAWQRQWLDQDACAKQIAFWKQALAGAPTLLALPTDRPRPAMQDHAGDTLDVRLDEALTTKLRTFANEHGVTTYMVLLASWAALLGRLSNQDDVVVGTAVAGRNRAEVEPLIGFFVNTLALRFDLTGEPTVADLLARVRHQVLEAQAHQDLSFDQMVDAVKPARSTAHTPIFQTMLTLNNQALDETAFPGLEAVPATIEAKLSKFDLSLDLVDGERDIDGMLTYASALFDRGTVRRYAGYWLRLLAAMVDAHDPVETHRPAADLPILGADELSQLLQVRNATAHRFPDQSFAHQVFEAQVARAGDAVAAVFGQQTLTYAELNLRANRLAHRLREAGVGADDRVGICIERSPDLIVAILAVLKAGGAYVPIDPALPQRRLDDLLRDSAPKALLTNAAMRTRWHTAGVTPETDTPWLCLDREADAIATQPEHDPDPQACGLTMRHLAYVIYTSGSTGMPKGVMIEHGQLLNYLYWALDAYPEGRACSVMSSSIAFDATVTSLYLPLLSGGCVHLVPEGEEIEGLERLLRELEQPALIKITPAHLAEVGRHLQAQGAHPAPKLFVVGGEALPSSTVALWRALSPQAVIINEYGPTETVVGCIVHEAEHGIADGHRHATRTKTPVAKLPILGADELSILLEGWNDTDRAYPDHLLVHQLFEARAERDGDATALIFGQERLTYAALNRRANRLAHRLRALGAKPGERVGICTRRNTSMLVAVLATLKSGAAYVPLDIAFPRERLVQIIEDSQTTLVLADDDGRRTLERDAANPAIARLRMIDPAAMDDAPDAPDHDPAPWPGSRPETQLAYVMFTSGSTGRPKGVCVPHAAVVNFISAMAEHPGLDAHDTLCAVTTLSFDISVLELLLPLSVGARLALADRETVVDGTALAGFIDAVGATVVQATPATWHMLIDAGWSAGAGMRLLCGGEAWQSGLAGKLTEGGARLWNMYGPTETTVWSMTAQIAPAADAEAAPTTATYLPIGRPIANTRVYILDAHRHPVPIGVTGELYIAGAGVARGYLDRPELTAERFVANPFDPVPGARMYRTGDLCRWLPDGNIDYVGRNDFQVKIRGFRIELGEIESRLSGCDGVREAVVLAREDAAGEKRLVAYCLAIDGFDAAALRARLGEELPAYMVPSAFVRMDAWPLTPNGKIDRNALPPPDGDAFAQTAYEPPQTPVERIVADIWQSMLGIDRVGRNDDFFALGGHSLLLLRMLAALGDRGVALGIQDIYRHSTLHAIAAAASMASPEPEAWLQARSWPHAAGDVAGVKTLAVAPADSAGRREFATVLARCAPALRPARILVADDPQAALRAAQADAVAGSPAVGAPSTDTLMTALAQVRAGSTQALAGAPVREPIAFTALHRDMASMHDRDHLHVVPLPGWWSPDDLREAFAALVRSQDMLHAAIDLETGLLHVLEADAYRAGHVPAVDLRALPAAAARDAIDRVVVALREAKAASPTGYSAAVVSRDDTDHMLLVHGDHLLWDGRSFDAIADAMMGMLTGAGTPPPRPYLDFADACIAVHAPEVLDHAAREFDAAALAATMRATATALQARASMPPQMVVARFDGVGEDSAERAFSIFARIVAAAIGLPRFGAVLTHHGRQLGADGFFGQVGLFVDKIPVDVDADTRFETTMRRIGALHRGGIRYADWHDGGDPRIAGTLPPPRDEISFNWQPAAPAELEIEAAGLDNALARLESVGIICEFFACEGRMDMVFAYRGDHEGRETVAAIVKSESGTLIDTQAPSAGSEHAPASAIAVPAVEPVIVVEDLRKRYDTAEVVKGISFTVPKGCCFGILGPNGAGKTSLLGMIEGIVPITSGRITVMGFDVATQIRRIQPKFGVQLQANNYFPYLTVAELLTFYTELRAAASGKVNLPPAQRLLERLDLSDKLKFKVDQLSGGQKQRLSLVLALLADPEIIFLDEPTAALDPHSRRYTWEFIEELKQDRNRTIVLTTHYMEEAERLCDEIMIMNRGEVVGQGNPSSMIAELSASQQLRVRIDSAAAGEEIAAAMGDRYRTSWDPFTESVLIATDDVANALRETLSQAESRQAGIQSIQVDRISLEDVFLNKTGKELKP